jgi:acyl-CoA synthetase (AMP-forming)/AMP-acid ligase II
VTPQGNLGDLVDRTGDPEKTALIDLGEPGGPREYSHAALDGMARAVARGLVRAGHRRGERIAILAANRAEFLATYLGTMRAGMVSVPLSFKSPRETIDYVLRDAGAARVFVDPDRRGLVPGGLPAVELDGAGWSAFTDPGDFDTVAPGAGDVAMFLYTSGSTGRPKGVPLTHAGQWWPIDHRLALTPDLGRHRFLVAAPLYHMNALGLSKLALAGHATVVLLPQFRAASYIEAIGRYRCTWLTSVPTMMALVARETALLARTDLSSVERVGMGSAPLTQRLVDRVRAAFPGALLTNGYGTTETGPVSFGPHPDGHPRPDLALGYPAAGVDVRLVDGDDRNAAQGVLELRTPALMSGYHNLSERTAQVMTADGYYVTGDVMRRDELGFYYFVGRADDMFVCGGENIYPGEVELVLERHPRIAQACVVPVDDEVRGQKPVAFVVAGPGARLSEDEVKDWALRHAPPYQHPRHVAFVDELPLAGTNKIDRHALAARAAALWAKEAP